MNKLLKENYTGSGLHKGDFMSIYETWGLLNQMANVGLAVIAGSILLVVFR